MFCRKKALFVLFFVYINAKRGDKLHLRKSTKLKPRGNRGTCMGDMTEKRDEYLELCIRLRLASLLLSTAVYLRGMQTRGILNPSAWGIVIGMLVSCLLGNALYLRAETLKEERSRRAIGAILGLELAAYGIFIYMSGGLSSSYLWYGFCCILISLSGNLGSRISLVAVLWCFGCALAGKSDGNPVRLESNILVGVLVMFGAFYVLRSSENSVRARREELKALNLCLVEENRRTERALARVADMYEGFSLMAMNDAERVLSELATLVAGSVSPHGAVLLRWSEEQTIQEVIIRGMPQKQGEELVSRVVSQEVCPATLRVSGQTYEVFPLEGSGGGGILMMEVANPDDLEAEGPIMAELTRREREFYVRLCGIIFRGLDMQSQMEAYISAEEKNRIADEIHDTVIQKLFGLNCGLKELELFVKGDEAKRQDALARILTLETTAALTMRELRETVYGRNFAESGEQSFTGRLNSYMAEAERQYEVEIPIEVDAGAETLSAAQKTVLYRVACEAVNNAARHGGATEISVEVHAEDDGYVLTVRDNGSGFREGRPVRTGGQGHPKYEEGCGTARRYARAEERAGRGDGNQAHLAGEHGKEGESICIWSWMTIRFRARGWSKLYTCIIRRRRFWRQARCTRLCPVLTNPR